MILPWNQDIWNRLTGDQRGNAHAWLFAGPRGLGKLELGVDFARHLLGDPANFDRVSNPDFHVLMPEQSLDVEGTPLQQYGLRYYATPAGQKAKSIISVDQVRLLAAGLITYAHGARKVVLISPADQMNINAANALLKVLEEPPSDTIFILITDGPGSLPATVRSRCSVVRFRVPPRAQGLAWLSNQSEGQIDPELQLDVAGGAPLLAARLGRSDFLTVRARVIDDIQSALADKVDVVSLCEGWKNVDKGQALGILRSLLTDLVRVRFQPKPPHLLNPDRLDWLQHAAKGIHLSKTFTLMDRIGAHLQDTNSPLDGNLVMAELLLEFSDIAR